eukprot:1223885-Prymnesium_polylepis.1
MRQRCADGSRVVQLREGPARSTYWKELNLLLKPVLSDLDGVLEHSAADASTENITRTVEQALQSSSGRSGGDESILKTVASRLCLVARDEKTLPSSLVEIVRKRTDELYEAVEALLPTFRVVMAAVLRKAGMDPDKI